MSLTKYNNLFKLKNGKEPIDQNFKNTVISKIAVNLQNNTINNMYRLIVSIGVPRSVFFNWVINL